MDKKTVFVGISGGVDSALSALLLKEQGFEVVGVFIKTWHPDFLPCNEEEERRDAMRVAAKIGIPFLTFDLEEVYKKEVGEYMINEYKRGRTPNPDVMCNKEVKFGGFLKKALEMGADYVATGHYAQKVVDGGVHHLIKGNDEDKDQSYFLWTLKQDQLEKTIFPVGHLPKDEVRKLALKKGLPVAEKKDSQGICFLGDIDLDKFLKHYIKEEQGRVLNEKGEEVGFHDGVSFYTLGARRGFTITKKSPEDKPYYIVAKDIKANTLTVSHDKVREQNASTEYMLEDLSWTHKEPESGKDYEAQIRYHGEFIPAQVSEIKEGKVRVIFSKPTLVAPGQSVVFYENNKVLGGGVVIDSVF